MSHRPFGSRRDRPVDVACPECGHAELRVLRGCRATTVHCPGCRSAFRLADLAPRLGSDAFERLAEAVGEHLADRV